MASFFDKLHGRTPAAVTTTTVRAPTPSPRQRIAIMNSAPAAVVPPRIETTAPTPKKEGKADAKPATREKIPAGAAENGKVKRVKNCDPAPSMRRTQSSSTVLPPSKKRRASPTSAVKKDPLPRDVTRLVMPTLKNEVKRRRTASPTIRIHRSPSDDETDFSEPVKLFRDDTPDVTHQKPPVERDMLNPRAGEDTEFRHAKELTCEVDNESYIPEDPANPALEVTVKLPFGEEIFKLLRPKKKDEYHPSDDVVSIVSLLLTYFLPSDTLPVNTTIQDYIYRVNKAIKSPTAEHVLPLLTHINDKVLSLRPFTPIIQQMSSMPRDLLLRIILQCYTRQVSPRVDHLKKYDAFSSRVYGELNSPFLSRIFSEVGLSPGMTFLDLGCGVGNCIIQAAGETGCNAVGIEIMDHAADLAVAQIAEFEARMRAWGLSHGEITFYHGDILTHPAIPVVIQQADVVLCNNYAFSATLNDSLLRLFLDLREGAKIVSLRSFIPLGKDGRVRGARGGMGEMLRVEKFRFDRNSVSWMDREGDYFVSTIARGGSGCETPLSGEDV